ncbi:MAG TPA: 3-oxoacid CoA-transferase subunit A [Clostridiales bacterium]|nr:3-oxoacid CoA-transferase subunit A [Clostridiales bacterium]HQP69853.1 3-oxoacid CoA-transferase subunit A [Clostridiales bacterium]
MKKVVDKNELRHLLKDGISIMFGGFMACGTPQGLVDLLLEMNVKDLTLICNDAGFPDRGIGKLIVNKQVKKLITSHIGLNPEAGKQMNEGTLEVLLVPQGTLAEQIRAEGSGIGGFLTPTGVGTSVETGKQKMTIDGKEYLLEMPMRADFAMLRGSITDTDGNIYYKGTTRNFNPLMALAADTVIVETEELVERGQIKPEDVMTLGVLVRYIVKEEKK